MPVRLDKIDGIMLDKLEVLDKESKPWAKNEIRNGYNLAIDVQGAVEITMNRDKLARIIFDAFLIDGTWRNLSTWEKYRMAKDFENTRVVKLADAIIQSFPEIVERVK